MARKLNAPEGEHPAAPKGHNSAVAPLTDDEQADLQAYFSLKIRAQQRKAAEAKAKYDAEREEVNGLFARVKGELKIIRKEFEEVLAAQDMSEAEFLASEAKRHRRFSLGGLPVGAQMALDLGPTSTADEMQLAHTDGKRAGLRGADPVPPSHVSGIMVPEWMRGWHEGQAEIAMRMGRAEAILEARAAPPSGPEEAEPEEEFDPAKAARKLKKSGFMEPAPAAQPEMADA
jgi:hypothetical protein